MNKPADSKKEPQMWLRKDCLTKHVFIMGVICIDEQIWTSLVGKLKALSEQARRVQTQFDPKTSDG